MLSLAAGSARAGGPPQIDSSWATDVTATSAALHALVNPGGFATTYRFEYIADAAYQANLAAGRDGFEGAVKAPPGPAAVLGSGSADQEALQHIGALSSATAYHYRIAASSIGGAVLGIAHTFTSQETAQLFGLPDNRGWEMVSPIEKNGGAIQGFGQNSGGDTLQAAADGGAITYGSLSSFGEGGQGAPVASQYISRRGLGGWSTQDIAVPLFSGSYGDHPEGVPYQLFSADLTAGLLLSGQRCRGSGAGCPVANPSLPGTGAPVGYQNYYLRDNVNGSFEALLTDSNPGPLALSPANFELDFAGASSDLGHILLSTCAALTLNATELMGGGGSCDPAAPNLYEWSGSGFTLVNLLPGESQGAPGAALAAQSRAISANGSRVYWTEGGDIYLREGAQTTQIDAGVGGGGTFQTAAVDGSVAFFTKAGHLYRYDVAAEEATDLTPGGGVQGVLGASDDGSQVYYLTTADLFLWSGGTTVPVAAAAAPTDYPPSTGTARVSPDGAHLVFLSAASLTGYDNTDQHTGLPESEVYLYSAPSGAGEGTLACVSCNPTGERPAGPSSIPGAVANGEGSSATRAYKPRDLSADGRRLFFDSGDALVLQDTNKEPDVYEWEAQGVGTCRRPGGCVALISSGRSGEGASFVDASADGSSAFFLTDGSLVRSDPGSVDVYVAREGGGFPQPVAPTECVGDACQSLPSAPDDPAPGTLASGSDNPAVHFPKPKHKAGHRHKHAHRRTSSRARGVR